MARPTKATVDYFPHDTNQGRSIFIFEGKYGNDGYAFWYKLLELLGRTENHFWDCKNPHNLEYLQTITRIDGNIASEMLDKLSLLGSIDKNLWKEKIIWSDNFVKNISDAYKRREVNVPRKADVWGLCKQKRIKDGINVGRNPQIRLNKIKVNKIKENIYIAVFDHWNSKGIIVHKKLTDKIKTQIKNALLEFNEAETTEAIDNYSSILSGKEYFFTYRWTLQDFLHRGLRKFVTVAQPFDNYKAKELTRGKSKRIKPKAQPTKAKTEEDEQRKREFEEEFGIDMKTGEPIKQETKP